jgi:sodium/hydrogen antiporter
MCRKVSWSLLASLLASTDLVLPKVVHGLSIPLGKLGFYLPRTLSQAFDSTTSDDPQPFRVRDRPEAAGGVLRERRRQQTPTSGQSTPAPSSAPTERPLFRIGGTVIRDRETGMMTPVDDGERSTPPDRIANRTIRFPDEAQSMSKSDG